jgi:uncharacterized protein (TIGR02117 family)
MKYFFPAIVSLLLTACATKPYVVNYSGETTGPNKNQVHVVSHGWHTGFVVSAAAIQKKIPELKQRFGEIPYIEFGWGDKSFYQARETTSGLTMRAIFWPTDSVVHAVAVPVKAPDYFPNSEIEDLCLSDGEFSSLIEFITGSFYRDDAGEILAMKQGIYGDSQFYKAVGNFHLINTCNSWTAKGLKSAGMGISPTFYLTAANIMNYLGERRRSLLKQSSTTAGRVSGCP